MEENEKKTENVQEKTEAVAKESAKAKNARIAKMMQEDFDLHLTDQITATINGSVQINKRYFKQYLQICTNLYINYTVIDKVLEGTGTRSYVLNSSKYDFLLAFIKEAREFTLFNRFIDMIEEAQNEAQKLKDDDYYSRYEECLDTPVDLFGLDYKVFEGLRQIRLGIFTKNDKTRDFLHMYIDDLEYYFENEKITKYTLEREIAARQSFYNESDVEMEESYLGRGIGEHAVPTLRNRNDLSIHFDYNAGENEFFPVEDAVAIVDRLKHDLAGIEFNPLGINHAGAFFLVNLVPNNSDAAKPIKQKKQKELKKLDESPAVQAESPSVPAREKTDLADVPSDYEKLWLSIFKPMTATLTKERKYKEAPYREFMMPFDSRTFVNQIVTLNNGIFTYDDVFQFLKLKIGEGSRMDTEFFCGLTDTGIHRAMKQVPQDYGFQISDKNDFENEDVRKIYRILSRIDSAVLKKQIANFIFDIEKDIKLPAIIIKEYTETYSVIPMYAKELIEHISENPGLVGGDAAVWVKQLEQEPIRCIKDSEDFIEYDGKRIQVKYRTDYEMKLLELLTESAPELAKIIRAELYLRSDWIVVDKLSGEKKLCVVNQAAFRAQRKKSNDEIFEAETSLWNQNIYSLSHLIESIIDTIRKINENAFVSPIQRKVRRTKQEQKYDSIQWRADLDVYAEFDKEIKKFGGDNAGAMNKKLKIDTLLYNDIKSIGIVKPFMLDIKKSELLQMILAVCENYPNDYEETLATLRPLMLNLMFYEKTLAELLELAKDCDVQEEAETLMKTVSAENENEDQVKEKIRELILQAIKKEIEKESQTVSKGDSVAPEES